MEGEAVPSRRWFFSAIECRDTTVHASDMEGGVGGRACPRAGSKPGRGRPAGMPALPEQESREVEGDAGWRACLRAGEWMAESMEGSGMGNDSGDVERSGPPPGPCRNADAFRSESRSGAVDWDSAF